MFKAADQPLNFEATVEAEILDLRSRFRVKAVRYDPYQMAAVAQRLAKRGAPMEEFPQSVPNITQAAQRLYDLIKDRNFEAYPDDAIRLAVSRAAAVEGPRGWKISKDKQSHKIDIVVALGMAALAATEAPKSSYDGSLRWVTGDYGPRETQQQPEARPSPTVGAIAALAMFNVH